MIQRDQYEMAWASTHHVGREWDALRLMTDLMAWLYPASEFDFGHITLSDHNFGDRSLDFCLKLAETAEDSEHKAPVIAFLQFLKTLPEDWRESPDEDDWS